MRERRCIVSGAVREDSDLVRFVVGPDDTIVPDLAGRLPGRGIWVSADRAALEAAIRRKAFARAAGGPVQVPPDLVATLEALLRRRAADYLGLARRAGLVVTGFSKVESVLADPHARVKALLTAADGAQDGQRKLLGAARRADRDLPLVTAFDAAELGLALGVPLVVHAALLEGGLADKLLIELRRWSGVAGAGGAAASTSGPAPEGAGAGRPAPSDQIATAPPKTGGRRPVPGPRRTRSRPRNRTE